jgi:hypothetical protein
MENTVWKMYEAGYTITEIADYLYMDEEHIRTILSWFY